MPKSINFFAFQKKTFAFWKMMAYNKNRKKENVYFSKNLFHFIIFKSC